MMMMMMIKLPEEEYFFILFLLFAFSKQPHFLVVLQRCSLHVCLSVPFVGIHLGL